jgi:uncharacterized protein involved in outer membrane biogenesis
MLGRQIRIAGPVALHWGGRTEIEADDITVANASWDSERIMFAAHRLDIVLDLGSVFRGPVLIPRLTLQQWRLLLETSATGAKNWHFGASAAAPRHRADVHTLQRPITTRENAMPRPRSTC